jgi:uncharacterized protein YecE (DUF72 family)
MTHRLPYRLGLPAWAFAGWRGRYFTDRPSQLASYARVFNTVEGNTTFYRIPDAGTVARWRDAVAGTGLRFCFKLPREVTHEPRPDLASLDRFLKAIAPIEEHLGPLLLQFPAAVGPEQLPLLHTLFSQIPHNWSCAVEVRHRAFFDDPAPLASLLDNYGFGRVVLDARPLYRGDVSHPEVAEALHQKPDLPVLTDVANNLAFVRLVLHPDPQYNDRYIDEWASRVAGYLEAGHATIMTIHCPNNLHCPKFALQFHDALRVHRPCLPPLPDWPIPQQQSLI